MKNAAKKQDLKAGLKNLKGQRDLNDLKILMSLLRRKRELGLIQNLKVHLVKNLIQTETVMTLHLKRNRKTQGRIKSENQIPKVKERILIEKVILKKHQIKIQTETRKLQKRITMIQNPDKCLKSQKKLKHQNFRNS